MLKQTLHLSKSRPQVHELGIRFVHVSRRRRLPSVTGPGIISQFADLLLSARKLSSHRNRSRLLRGSEELFPEPAVSRLASLVNSSSRQRVGCLVA
jgi:hypothetical protein